MLTPTSVTFAGRVTVKLRYLSEGRPARRPSREWDGVQDFSLFEIVDPKPAQEILRGNNLCGVPMSAFTVLAPRYVGIGLERRAQKDELAIVVYVIEELPDVRLDRGICAVFRYQ
jgi:hypothetical protein